jgi:hypothetical protein
MFERLTAEEHELVVAKHGQNEADASTISQAAAVRCVRCEPREERAKLRRSARLCDGLLTSGMTLPQTAAPAEPRWPAAGAP